METYTEPRPQTAMELEPGIVYVDLDRLIEPEWKALIPRLKKAKGIVFDMRGYPGEVGITALAHLTRSPIRSAKWCIPRRQCPTRLDSRLMKAAGMYSRRNRISALNVSSLPMAGPSVMPKR